MLLRDDRQMAISEVETLCMEAAERYAAAAGKADDATLAALFSELANQHQQFAAALARHIRADDDLPQPPDPDREAVKDVLTGIKSLLQGGARDTLLDEREQGEEALANAVRVALKLENPDEERTLLEDILAHAKAAKGKLSAARARP